MGSLLKTELGRKIVAQVTVKNVKLDIGHDLAGAYCDFYLNGKKMGYFNDDGYGGETEIEYENKACQEIFESFLIGNNVAQIMFDNGWDFLKDVKKIDIHCQAEETINEAINAGQQLKAEKKAEKRIQKDCENGFCFGTVQSYRLLKFKVPLKALTLSPQGREALQRAYDKVKAEMKAGDKLFNTETQLKELGVKL